MLNSITWGQYFSTIIAVLIIYYIAIGFRYFKWEILNVIGIKIIETDLLSTKSIVGLQTNNSSKNIKDNLPKTTLEIDVASLIQLYSDEIKAFVKETHNIEINKEEIIDSVRIISLKYAALKESDYSNDLKMFVFNEINQQYPKLLEVKDLNKIWN